LFSAIVVLQVCRQSNYHKHALFLAEKYKQHDWYAHGNVMSYYTYACRYVKIQLEDINQYRDALDYIKRCPPQSVSDHS